MNTLGNQLELGEQNQAMRLGVGGCLVVLLVCGFLYFAAQQVKRNEESSPVEKRQAQKHQLEKQESPKLQQVATAQPLAMQKVSLPAPPPVNAQNTPQQEVVTPVAQAPKAEVLTEKNVQKKDYKKIQKAQPIVQKRVVDVSKHQSNASEQMLQQVEAGKGPNIEINWPSAANQRKALFSILVDCLGVGLGVLVDGNVTPIHDSGRQYSRLVRMVGGKMVEREARFHRQSGINGIAVRLFPRNLDSRLLAGLASIAPQTLSKYSQVQGVYVLNGGSLWVKNIYFDGKLHQGNILLARGACRR